MYLIKLCALSFFIVSNVLATQYAHNPFLLGGLPQTPGSPNQPQPNQWNSVPQHQPQFNQPPTSKQTEQFLYQRPTEPVVTLQGSPLLPVGSTVEHIGVQLSSSATDLNKKCLQPTGLFPGSNCNKFVSCLNGVATEQPCPEGLHFNAKGLYCDRPENVECGAGPTSEVILHQSVTVQEPVTIRPVLHTTQIQSFVSGFSNRCLAAQGQFPSNACNTYLNCWDGVALEQPCPEGLLFNSKGYCDYSGNVNCEGRSLPGLPPAYAVQAEKRPSPVSSGSGQSSSAPTAAAVNPIALPPPSSAPPMTIADTALTSKCLKPRGQFPSTSCNKFVNCWDGNILEQDCPQGFLFSTKGYCDFPYNVHCGTRTVSNEVANTKSGCPLENGTFRDKSKCSSYYTCSFNVVVARYDCPVGLNFNDVIGVCDYEYRVDCSQEPLAFPSKSNPVPKLNEDIPEVNFLPQANEDTTPQYDCPVDFGTFRDVQNCSIYYTCVSRKIVAKYICPEGFSFNDDIGICDYAERVDKPPKIYQVQRNVMPQIPANFQEKIEKCTPGTVFRLNPQCTAVCLCRDGMAEIVQCPAGLAYDSKMDKCILPHLAKWNKVWHKPATPDLFPTRRKHRRNNIFEAVRKQRH